MEWRNFIGDKKIPENCHYCLRKLSYEWWMDIKDEMLSYTVLKDCLSERNLEVIFYFMERKKRLTIGESLRSRDSTLGESLSENVGGSEKSQ